MTINRRKKGLLALVCTMLLLFTTFYLVTPAEAADNQVHNPSFEDGGSSQTATGWSTWGPNPEADYYQAGGVTGGSNEGVHWNASSYTVYTYQT
ncbi:hypothetical protein HQN90_21790 [Paenibacillus alba]|uniref:hypothetical protein n=1 Tax=Paenibacillus alba TaxID=1197127 RepID=UPI00156773F5|nr:hypothetical protein [Paenibacillus alba]NQX68761.1 hypothetical protein [Paenibacillus alba]